MTWPNRESVRETASKLADAVQHSDRSPVLGRPHPLTRLSRHANRTLTHAHDTSFGTLHIVVKEAKTVGKILLLGTALSAVAGLGLNEAHALFQASAGVFQEPWPIVVAAASEVATIGSTIVYGSIAAVKVIEHASVNAAKTAADLAESGAVATEALVDTAFHGARGAVRRRKQKDQ